MGPPGLEGEIKGRSKHPRAERDVGEERNPSDAEQLIYRRRREDWLSDSDGAAGGLLPGDMAAAARRAALELGKAILVARDAWTGDHTDDVGLLCEELAEELDLDELSRANLLAAAQLHDIGKLTLPESILQKPGPLNAEEWRAVREHTPAGERIISAVPELTDVGTIVRHSHEHWDGGGYPDGLAGEEIPLESRIILCADAFHAVRSPRPYRPGRSAPGALEEIRAHAGGQFDPEVVEALERVVEKLRASQSQRFSSSTGTTLRSRRLAALLLAAPAPVAGRRLGGDGGPKAPGTGPGRRGHAYAYGRAKRLANRILPSRHPPA